MMFAPPKAVALTALLALSLSLFSCMPKPVVEETDTEWQGKEELELPSVNTELDGRYNEYESTLPLAFTTTSVTDKSAFEYEETEDGITIKKYVGKDNIVMIPSEIDGIAVTTLKSNAFADSSASVRALHIPDSVTSVELGALASMNSLVTLRIPTVGNDVYSHFGYIFGCERYDEQPVRIPPSLDTVIVGGGTHIADNAFAGCKSLSAISLPDSIENIGKFSFFECGDLVYVKMSENIRSIGNYAFGYCNSLRNIDTKNTENIGFGAFFEAGALSSLTVPFAGGKIDENSYIGYIFGAETPDYNDEFVPHSLRSVNITGCDSIADRAFASCAYIQNITLPDSISKIGIRSFYSCRSLETVSLPASLLSIGDDAFFACESLKTVNFGDKLEKIGMQAFFACKSLNNIVIPASVREIGSSAFANCSALSDVKICNVEKLGKDVFLNCPYSKAGN